MEKILLNLANRELLDFCKENGINPSGSHTEKVARGYRYNLIREETQEVLLSILFTKNSIPQFQLSDEAKAERATKIEQLRTNMPGYILGDLTPFATDSDILEICDLNDRKAAIHNRAFTQSKLGR